MAWIGKEQEESKEGAVNLLRFLLPSLGILLLTAGLSQLYIGLHNVDLGYNFQGANFPADLGTDGVTRSPGELYMLGIGQIYRSPWLIIAGTALIAISSPLLRHPTSRGSP